MSLPDSIDHEATLVVRDARAEGKRPALIVALHGYGMDERQIETLVNINPGFDHVLIAPRAPIALAEGGFAWAPLSLHDSGPTVEQDDLNTFVERFTKYIAKMTAATDADPDRVYIVGYSQGGAMAISLALMTPEVATAFVSLAGTILPDALLGINRDDRHPSLFIGHGTRDLAVSTDEMCAGVSQLRQHGLEITYREYPIPHVVSQAQRRDVSRWLTDLDNSTIIE